jgi:alanyl-tRNA synthetase
VTAGNAEQYFLSQLDELNEIRTLLKGAQNPVKALTALQDEVRTLKKQLEQLVAGQASALKDQLKGQVAQVNGVNFIAAKLPLQDANAIKTLAFQLENEVGNACIVLGAEIDGKPQLMVAISRELTENVKKLHAGNIVRELARDIQGGGGGQSFFAAAGGKDAKGLDKAIARAKELL